ncbi:sensor domain-containing protein [Cellvibrio japonicus]|uniref:Diguanylate cyclase/phosphodiesterase domain 2 (EAL) n=1 Tax=Cellvibrio japonicus (strain Ueda107) TaxID=498211 RepID=B3PKS7_CELJU|nr:EAL domain-containing protein [Cellvibrio japonicus]ACE84668.1 Diguanylate cyclase/phosphodiesterase domain 2 (EAL) [Cellvibrio japonicus Ueda107]QEI11489.1 EAL domain-containing protein [Cellvibrio japonicus]QEI15063.1 EAL domain-containing protein [Cellvibrio japonicus]QEI18643.1 EAL domain-containing protein [Cellvibrio japonicus]
MKNPSSIIPPDLYRRAQKRLMDQGERSLFAPPLTETQQLKRDVQIYQLALEMQREEWRQAQTQLQTTIAQQRVAEEQLRTSARLLEASQAIANVGSVEMEFPSRRLYWSAETYRIHDTSPEEYTPTFDLSLDHYLPDSRQKLQAALQKALETGEVFDLELEKYTFKGRKIDVRTTCTATFDQLGRLIRLTGIFQDISARKQAERYQLHHSHILELLLQHAPLQQVLEAIALDVERTNPHMLCTILLLDSEGKHLIHGAAPSLPVFYIQAINGGAIGPRAGSCGTAAFTGKRVVVEDINTHPFWADYKQLALRAGLQSCWSQPILSATGKVLGTFAIYHNHPSQPEPHDLQLIDNEARLAALAIETTRAENRLQLTACVFSHAREGILITDAQGNIIEVNTTFTDITGYTRDDVIGKNPRLLQSNKHDAVFFERLWHSLVNEGAWCGEIWNKRKNGDLYVASMTISAVKDSRGQITHFVDLFNDITHIKEHQRQLEHIAHYDALTHLPNRVLLADRMKQALLHSQRSGLSLAVMYIDLDGFKAINDQYGHDLGDQLLVAISSRFKSVLRESDTLARIGGDEFVVVLNELEQPAAYQPVLDRLLATAADPLILRDQALRITASIGITLYPSDTADAEQLIRHADQAMYLAKQRGKNGWHLFDVDRDVATKHQYESLERIRLALEQREFILHYQPKVNMKTGALVGAEALIRWQHPTRGMISPGEFLPLIEEHPIGLDVGEWVIDTALSQIEHWQREGLALPVSVNLCALQLQQGRFAQRLSELLQAHPDVAPGQLELEIVETSALADMTDVANTMRACNALGVRFAVDDFGTGYSSLTYLKRLPAETLKIDQSFIRDMLDDPDDFAIVKGVISLAQAFHRQVIAEGVESVAHGEMLIPLGCELAQGYGIARPMLAGEISSWIQRWTPDPRWTYFARADAPEC